MRKEKKKEGAIICCDKCLRNITAGHIIRHQTTNYCNKRYNENLIKSTLKIIVHFGKNLIIVKISNCERDNLKSKRSRITGSALFGQNFLTEFFGQKHKFFGKKQCWIKFAQP